MNPKLISIIKRNLLLYTIARRIEKIRIRSVKGRNNKIYNQGVLISVKYDITGNNNIITINKRAVLSNVTIVIRGDNHKLIIGEDCKFSGGSVWFEDNSCKIIIGNKTSIESAHLAVTEPDIGCDCMLSKGIEFRTGDSHSIINNTTKERINYARNIDVEDHVWVGANATILKGVRIATGSIISTSAIVTNNIPANCIAAGIPAKVIKTDINWLRDRIYQE